MSRAMIVGLVVVVIVMVIALALIRGPFAPPEDGGPVIVINPGDEGLFNDIPLGRLGIREVTCARDVPVRHKTTGNDKPTIPSRFVHTNGISRIVVTTADGSREVDTISFDVENGSGNPVSLERDPKNHRATWKLEDQILPGDSSIPLTQWPEEMIGPITRIDFGNGDELDKVREVRIHYYKASRGKPCN